MFKCVFSPSGSKRWCALSYSESNVQGLVCYVSMVSVIQLLVLCWDMNSCDLCPRLLHIREDQGAASKRDLDMQAHHVIFIIKTTTWPVEVTTAHSCKQ